MGPKQALGLDRIEAAVAERIAAQQTPPRQHQPAEYAEATNRLHRIGRAGGLVLAAPRQSGGDHPLVQADRGDRRSHAPSALMRGRPRSAARPTSSASSRRTPSRPSRSARSRASGRATTTTSWSVGTRPASPANASRSSALDRVAVDGAADLARHGQAQAWAFRGGFAVRGKRVEHEETVADRPSLAVDALELRAARQPPALARPREHGAGAPPPSDGEPLPALRATALQGQTAGARAHARAEPVGAGALSLLGLVGALHGSAKGVVDGGPV